LCEKGEAIDIYADEIHHHSHREVKKVTKRNEKTVKEKSRWKNTKKKQKIQFGHFGNRNCVLLLKLIS